jgi:hypothetical protein
VKLKFLFGADVGRDAVGEARSLVVADVSDSHKWHYFSRYAQFYEHHFTTFLVSMFSITIIALNFNFKIFVISSSHFIF